MLVDIRENVLNQSREGISDGFNGQCLRVSKPVTERSNCGLEMKYPSRSSEHIQICLQLDGLDVVTISRVWRKGMWIDF